MQMMRVLWGGVYSTGTRLTPARNKSHPLPLSCLYLHTYVFVFGFVFVFVFCMYLYVFVFARHSRETCLIQGRNKLCPPLFPIVFACVLVCICICFCMYICICLCYTQQRDMSDTMEKQIVPTAAEHCCRSPTYLPHINECLPYQIFATYQFTFYYH